MLEIDLMFTHKNAARGLALRWVGTWSAAAAIAALAFGLTGCVSEGDRFSATAGAIDRLLTESTHDSLATTTPETSSFTNARTRETGVSPDLLPVIYFDFDPYIIPDPIVVDPFNRFPYGEVYGGLFRFSSGNDGTVEPDLVARFSISDDGRTYRFVLRDAARFSDGSAVTAEDVKGSWERALSATDRAERASEVFGLIAGAVDMLDGDAEILDGVEVVDDSTLEVRLVRPAPYFLHLLADPLASVLSLRNIARWGTANWAEHHRYSIHSSSGRRALTFDELPVGTGPFRIVEFTWRQSAILEPNPHYWDVVAGGQVVVNMRPEFDGASLAVDLADRDTWRVDSNTAKDVQDGVERSLGNASLNVFRAQVFNTEPQVAWLALNASIPPFDDVEFRRALLHATNNNPPDTGLIDAYPDESASGLVPPSLSPEVNLETRESKLDRGLANSALARSRYQDAATRPEIRFVSGPRIAPSGVLDEIFAPWANWLEVDVDLSEAARYRRLEFEDAISDGTLQMRLVNLEVDYPDPHSILSLIPSTFGPVAHSDEYALVASMIESAEMVRDPAERFARYRAIEAHVIDRALVIPLWWESGTTSVLVKPYISGYKVPAYGGSMYEDVVVDTTHPDYPRERLSDGWAR